MSEKEYPKTHPYGRCHCDNNSNKHAAGMCNGPAAYRVERGRSSLPVCTLCHQSGDTIVEILVKPNDSPFAFFNYDPAGSMILALAFSIQNALNNPEQTREKDVEVTDNLLPFHTGTKPESVH
jgi:hypothetical protein